MTREEEIKQAVEEYCNSTDPILLNIAEYNFEKGAQWADKNPQSPWISVKDDLPCNHEELTYEKDSRFTKNVLIRCIKVTNGEVLYKDTIMSKYCSKKWVWTTLNNNYKVTHWMPIPELPKE